MILDKCPNCPGKKFYIKHKNGEKLIREEAILAHCFSCMGGYVDGKEPCEIKECCLYHFSPFQRSKKIDK